MLQYTPNTQKEKTAFLDCNSFFLEDEVCLTKTKSAPSEPEDCFSYQSLNTSFSGHSTSSSFQKLQQNKLKMNFQLKKSSRHINKDITFLNKQKQLQNSDQKKSDLILMNLKKSDQNKISKQALRRLPQTSLKLLLAQNRRKNTFLLSSDALNRNSEDLNKFLINFSSEKQTKEELNEQIQQKCDQLKRSFAFQFLPNNNFKFTSNEIQVNEQANVIQLVQQMTEDCKKSEKNIDNLLFSGDDEIDNFANDFKIKNIESNNFDNLKSQVGHTSKSKRVFSYDVDNLVNNNDDDDLINCRDQFSKFFSLN